MRHCIISLLLCLLVCCFARVLVDVDLSSAPPCELTVHRKTGEVVIVVEVEYESLPESLVSTCKLVQKSIRLEETDEARGRSRKPRRRHRKAKQIFVQKQPEKLDNGKQVMVDNTHLAMNDLEEGPSFASKSPSPNPIDTQLMENPCGTGGDLVEHELLTMVAGVTTSYSTNNRG
ncbi:hypothetical protein ACLB2K_043501 [Fragaria x ananassa]